MFTFHWAQIEGVICLLHIEIGKWALHMGMNANDAYATFTSVKHIAMLVKITM